MKAWLLTWISFSLIAGSIASTAPRKYLMAAMGDSITAGFFANTHIKALQPDWVLNFPPFTNKRSDSWASGKSIRSHYLLLEKSLLQAGDTTTVDMMNESVPGDKAHDMIAQAKKIKQAMDSGKYQSLKYVVLLVGANDACANDTPFGTADSKVLQGLQKTFEILSKIQQAEPIRILMSGIPKIPDLGLPDVVGTRTTLGMKCGFFRNDLLRSCTPLLNWKSSQDYEKRVAIVEHVNQVLEEAAHEASVQYPNLQIIFTNQLFHTAIDPEMLAIDCFHPSREGQQTISSTLWAEQPWFPIVNP